MIVTISDEGALKFSIFLKDNAVIHESNAYSTNDSMDIKTIIAMFFPDLVSFFMITFLQLIKGIFFKNFKTFGEFFIGQTNK